MSRFAASTIAVVLLASTSGAFAEPAKKQPSTEVLLDGLRAIAASTLSQSEGQGQVSAQSQQASPQSQPGSEDHDQGDDHASDVAIMKVCNHDNPSAQRSAICPHPNSPP